MYLLTAVYHESWVSSCVYKLRASKINKTMYAVYFLTAMCHVFWVGWYSMFWSRRKAKIIWPLLACHELEEIWWEGLRGRREKERHWLVEIWQEKVCAMHLICNKCLSYLGAKSNTNPWATTWNVDFCRNMRHGKMKRQRQTWRSMCGRWASPRAIWSNCSRPSKTLTRWACACLECCRHWQYKMLNAVEPLTPTPHTHTHTHTHTHKQQENFIFEEKWPLMRGLILWKYLYKKSAQSTVSKRMVSFEGILWQGVLKTIGSLFI